MLAPNPTVQHLQAARNLIADPEKWCVGRRHWNGQHCAIGAVEVATNLSSADNRREIRILAKAAQELFPKDRPQFDKAAHWVAHINNKFGHAATLKMFQRAIELAAAGEP